MANTYGLTWGQIKEACRQNITQLRLPITEFEEVVYTALQQTARYYNINEQPQFRRWNGTTYTPQLVSISSFETQNPVLGLDLNSDVDNSMDSPIYKVFDEFNGTVDASDYTTVAQAIELEVTELTATDSDTIEYEVIATDSDGTTYELIAETNVADELEESLYAVEGNVLFFAPKGGVESLYYSYYFTPPRPASDSEIVRIPQSVLPLLVLMFRQMYLARFGQVLDAQSKRTLDNLLRAIAQG